MSPEAAFQVVLALVQTANATLQTASQVSALIKKAKAEQRDVSDDELRKVIGEDDAARALLEQAIADEKAAEEKQAKA